MFEPLETATRAANKMKNFIFLSTLANKELLKFSLICVLLNQLNFSESLKYLRLFCCIFCFCRPLFQAMLVRGPNIKYLAGFV